MEEKKKVEVSLTLMHINTRCYSVIYLVEEGLSVANVEA